MKTRASILLLILLAAASLHADPQAVAARIKGDWNAQTGVWHKRLGPVDAASLAELAADPAVKTIHLDGVKLDLAAVQALATARTLKTLLIVHTDVGNLAMLRELAKMQSLEDIHVGSSTFGDEGLKVLCGLKNLKSLRLRHVTRDTANPITAAGVKAVADAYPDLEAFYINLHQMDDAMISRVGSDAEAQATDVGVGQPILPREGEKGAAKDERHSYRRQNRSGKGGCGSHQGLSRSGEARVSATDTP